MIAGHLQEKNGYYYAVLSYKDNQNKRKTKWIPTGLQVKGNKKKAEIWICQEWFSPQMQGFLGDTRSVTPLPAGVSVRYSPARPAVANHR